MHELFRVNIFLLGYYIISCASWIVLTFLRYPSENNSASWIHISPASLPGKKVQHSPKFLQPPSGNRFSAWEVKNLVIFKLQALLPSIMRRTP
jgi:hypothetical protein